MDDTTNRRRLLGGICMGLLSLTLAAHAFGWMLPGDGGPATHGEIASLGFLAVLQAALHAGSLIALTQLLRQHADRLALTGAALSMLGMVVAGRIIALWQLSLVADPAGLTHSSVASRLQETAPIVWVSIVPIGLMYPLGMLLLGVGLLRSRVVPRWIGALFVAGAVLFPIGRAVGVAPAVIASDLCLGICYAALCLLVLGREEWRHLSPGRWAPPSSGSALRNQLLPRSGAKGYGGEASLREISIEVLLPHSREKGSDDGPESYGILISTGCEGTPSSPVVLTATTR